MYIDNCSVINYTRDLPRPSDIFSLVQYYKNINFFQALKYICNLIDVDPYAKPDSNLPESLKITKMLMRMNSGEQIEDETPIRPISEEIWEYYKTPCVNDLWLEDGISYSVQKEFEIGFDNATNRITIPIRDETGVLCGVKGRLFKSELLENDLKYIYLEPCPKSKILYNYFRSHEHIKSEGCVFVGESEKFCAQLWSAGIKNSVALGGHSLSKKQIESLTRLGVKIILCFDKDISQEKIENLANQFIDGIETYAICDKDGILEEKESPSDDILKWKHLIENNIYKIK